MQFRSDRPELLFPELLIYECNSGQPNLNEVQDVSIYIFVIEVDPTLVVITDLVNPLMHFRSNQPELQRIQVCWCFLLFVSDEF